MDRGATLHRLARIRPNMPKVSVIVPSYNHAPFLRQRMESIVRQTFQDFELILLDDCSPDESRSILSEYGQDDRVRIEFNERNSGNTFKQWNKGVCLARGEYVWIAESDDYADERLLETLVPRLDANADAALCYARSWWVDEKGTTQGFVDDYIRDLGGLRWSEDFTVAGREECGRYLVFANTVQSASSVVFRREAYWKAGGADETLRYCGDWKMWASMALLGGQIAHVGKALNYYRSHSATVTAASPRSGLAAAETLAVVGWILQHLEPTAAVKAELNERLFPLWSAAVLTNRVPVGRRVSILRHARKIDARAFRRLVRPGLNALRLTALRRCRSLRAGARRNAGHETVA